MELNKDWVALQDVFYPTRKTLPRDAAQRTHVGTIHGVRDGERVIDAYSLSGHEDFSEWCGSTVVEFEAHWAGREIRWVERAAFDGYLGESLGETFGLSLNDQVELLRQKMEISFQEHFLIRGVRGWWNKVMPSSYGLLLKIEGRVTGVSSGSASGSPAASLPVCMNEQLFLVLVKRGQIEAFHRIEEEPFARERPQDFIRAVEEEYRLPIQGLSIHASDWVALMNDPNPWKSLAHLVRSDRASLMPFRWMPAVLLAFRGYFKV